MKTANQQFLEKFNKAFAENDTDFILEHVSDDIKWNVIGYQAVQGKEEFAEMLISMQLPDPQKLKIHNIITHGKSASVNGEITSKEGNSFGFCDVIKFSGFKNPKVKEMTSYVIEISR